MKSKMINNKKKKQILFEECAMMVNCKIMRGKLLERLEISNNSETSRVLGKYINDFTNFINIIENFIKERENLNITDKDDEKALKYYKSGNSRLDQIDRECNFSVFKLFDKYKEIHNKNYDKFYGREFGGNMVLDGTLK